ncbi:hypothetical protein C8R46DRAFT_1258044 [Mycena filopes]|nr:hypothetical protein C8R46DRAFT_1258044 [Mycena filopes]
MYRAALQPTDVNRPASTYLPTSRLPRTLDRPAFVPDTPPRQMLDALAPELVELPLPFIHHQLAVHADQMAEDISSFPIPGTIPAGRLPHALAVKLPSASPGDVEHIYPTHILAVSTPSKTATPEAPSLVAVHGIVFAANCIAPKLRPVGENNNPPGALYLPICPIALPSVPALLTLRTYMYNHRVDVLLSALFPLLPAPLTDAEVRSALASDRTKLRLATHLVCADPRPAQILGYAVRVQEVWRTVCCLGMYRAELWDALDLAWELVIIALNLAADA